MTEAEFLPLFDQYHDMVYRLALSYTRSPQDAEDIVQAVFLKLLSGANRPMPGKERAWLAQVTVNGCKDLLRSFWRRKSEPLEDTFVFQAPEEGTLFDTVMRLPAKYRVVVHLHYYEGYTCAEIGTLLRLRPSAVSMRLHRARKLLRSRLEEEEYEPLLSQHL